MRSLICRGRMRTWPPAMSTSRQQADIFNSLLARWFSLFGIKNSLFQLQGIQQKSPVFRSVLASGEGPFAENSQYFPADQGISDSGDAFAVASLHSHLVARFSALSRASPKLPEEARICATNWRSFFHTGRERDRLSARTPRFFRFISIGHFRESHWPIVQMVQEAIGPLEAASRNQPKIFAYSYGACGDQG
jgi:hypothetical protein